MTKFSGFDWQFQCNGCGYEGQRADDDEKKSIIMMLFHMVSHETISHPDRPEGFTVERQPSG